MSLTFALPHPVVQPLQVPTLAAVHGTSKPLDLNVSATGVVAVGGITTAGVIVVAASRRSRGQQARAKIVDMQAFENELGVQAPVGLWDPLGLSADGNMETFKRRRETEIKHGRISMLATMGYITPELTGKLPGFLSPSSGLTFDSIPNGLGAVSKVPLLGWVQIVLYCAVCEVSGISSRGENPGQFNFKPPLLTSDDPQMTTKRLNAELANGRLAMMAIIGMFFQDGLTGSAWGDWANYTASPLRAFENELGVQAPVGFWDPAGLSSDGDMENFVRRRETEIKHGRISMLATMGYITPEITGKIPGFLSPSQGISFSDIPNGLGAVSKVPALGWAQIVTYCAFCEISGGNNRGDAPGDFGWKVLTSADPEEKTKKLAAELANGRLAMMAIIGMFFQDGLTGSAWGDWANYTGSPLRAFESELGVQAPVGFFDPLGLAKDGDVDTFNRRRESELKHGRISMLAAMGYITPELFRLDGLLSPTLKLSFADVPNGLKALSVVPPGGWFQMIMYCAWVEVSGISERQDINYAKPGNFGFKQITSDDPEVLKKKLNAELANGRLAMMAIIGMFFQDGLTGSAWGNWDLYTDSPLRGGA